MKFGVCHSPVDFRALSRAYPCSLPLTPAHSRAYPCSLPLTPAHSRTRWCTNIYGKMTKAWSSALSIIQARQCYRRNCEYEEVRASYAFPLEIIYLTPLNGWNPYDISVNLTHRDYPERATNGEGPKSRNGRFNRTDKAYNGMAVVESVWCVCGRGIPSLMSTSAVQEPLRTSTTWLLTSFTTVRRRTSIPPTPLKISSTSSTHPTLWERPWHLVPGSSCPSSPESALSEPGSYVLHFANSDLALESN